jgi:large repetitive protein
VTPPPILFSAPVDGGFRVPVVDRSVGGRTDAGMVVIVNPIADAVVSGSGPISVTMPYDAFGVTQPSVSVSLSATTGDGRSLPSWLHFNAESGSFEGNPPPGVQSIEVKVIATDDQGHAVEQVFKIVVKQGDRTMLEPRTIERQAMVGRPGLAAQIRAAQLGGNRQILALARSADARTTQ